MSKRQEEMRGVVRGAAKWLPLLLGAMAVGAQAQTTGLPAPMSGDCSASATGAVVCTSTNGVAFAASATTDATDAANISSGTLSAARLPATSVGAGTVSSPTVTYDNTGRITAISGVVRRSYTAACFDDSYGYGAGATQQKNGYCALMKKDTPTMQPWLGNFAVSGTMMPTIAQSVLTNWAPNATYPSTAYIGGGENEYTNCSAGTANCVGNFQRSAAAAIYWAAVAPQHRTLMSNVTQTGTWSNNTALAPVNALTGNAFGSAVQSSTNGSTLSFTVPAGNGGSFGVYVYNSMATSGGTYTVSVDGVLQTDACNSNATTFNAFGCGGTASPATGPQRLRFAVAAGASHSVVITQTSSTAITFVAWDYVAATLPANTNAVIARNAGAAYDVSGVYATAMAAVVSQARADGLTTVMLSDDRSALLALPDGGVSTTTTATYAGSMQTNHPRDGGYLAMEQAALQAQVSNGYVVSVVGAGALDPDAASNVLHQWSSPFYGGTNNTYTGWSNAYRNLNVDNNYTTYGTLLYGGTSTGALGWRVGSGTLPDGTANAGYLGLFGNSNRVCVEKFTTAGALAQSNFAPVWCVNPATGNAAASGQVQSYLSTGAGFHGVLFTPASSSAACVAGDFADDANYHYVCTAANTWKRAALSTF